MPPPRSPTYYLYLVRTAGGALYTGIARDVAQRFAEHQACAAGRGPKSKGAKALRGKGPLELVYRRRIGPKGLALRVELRVKRLAKARKEWLIARPQRIRSILAAARASLAG